MVTKEVISHNNKREKEEKEREISSSLSSLSSSFSPLYLSEFELSFLMSLSHFYAQDCDVLVIEVGCGGVHDATNFLSADLSIITSIGKSEWRK